LVAVPVDDADLRRVEARCAVRRISVAVQRGLESAAVRRAIEGRPHTPAITATRLTHAALVEWRGKRRCDRVSSVAGFLPIGAISYCAYKWINSFTGLYLNSE
jgi:hypothetical protein